MIIDKSIVNNGISIELLNELIQQHGCLYERYDKLEAYYKGKHDILNRSRQSSDVANHTIVCNHAKYITDMSVSYLAGNPITYSVSEGFDIEPLKNEYLQQDISNTDNELIKDVSIFGRAYELIYVDESTNPRSVRLNRKNAFVVYDNSARKEPLFGVHYYRRFNVSGTCIGVMCTVYTSNMIYEYSSSQDNWKSMELENEQEHYFGAVPLIEYNNNDERQGDFEQVITLIDAYNLLQSDRVNDKEQFVEAFLFLSGIDLDTEQAKKLKKERILLGFEGSDARYLSKVMSESDVEVLRDCLKNDIHRLSMVPDLSDESFGNNLSGVAIKYKLMGFEQAVKNKERYITKGIRRRLMLYINFLCTKGSMSQIPLHRIDVIFTRNLPVNELEISQMIQNLSGIVSNETLLEQISFISDSKEEQKLINQEREQNRLDRIKEIEDMAAGGGY